jgi:SAM-dependent methyltransferase
MGFDQTAAKPFLEVLRSMGLVELRDGKYVNHPQTTRFFTTDSPISHLPSYQGMVAMIYGILDELENILRQGGDKYRDKLIGDQPFDDQTRWSRMARSMLGGGLHQAQLLLPHLKALPEWSSFQRMMDLGGGPGAYCLVFVSGHPQMQGVVFDQKAVAAETKKIIAEYGLEDRVTAQAGDYLNDAQLGRGYDFIWSCATLNFAKGRLVPLFAKIHQALNPGGVFASYHPSISGSGEEEWEMVVGMAPHAMLEMDLQFYDDEVAQAMLEAGFQSVQSKEIKGIHGFQRLDLARKAKA